MKIGFPIIEEETGICHAVWISTVLDSGKNNKVKWNSNVVPKPEELFEYYWYNNVLARIIKYRSITFKSDYERSDEKPINGPSGGLALALASHYDLSVSDMTDVEPSILLTGAVDEDNENPVPLTNKDSVISKGEFAVNYGYVLILHEEDYNMLNEESGRRDRESQLPNSIQELKEAMEKDEFDQGRAYVLPVNQDGHWKSPNKEHWVKGLGDFLELKPLFDSRPAASEIKLYPSTEADENESNENYTEDQIQQGTIGTLYQAALPSYYNRKYLDRFLKHNAKICKKDLFEDGLGLEALKNGTKEELFPDKESACYGENEYGHILIAGPTGCGKTFLTESLIFNTALELDKPVVYIAPTRALVYEVHKNLQKRFKFENNDDFYEDEIVFSSGEESGDDWRIIDAKFKIALIVNEKANIFLNSNAKLLKRVALVIFDEVHMLSDNSRGGVLDMLVAKLVREHKRRSKRENELIRIIFISTEDIFKKNKILESFFTFPSAYQESSAIKPVSISTESRPVNIQHRIQIHGMDQREPVDIVKFSKQSDRNIEYDKLENLCRNAISHADKINKKEDLFRDKSKNPIFKSIIELICERSRQFNKIIVVGNSTHRLKNYAKAVANKREQIKFDNNDDMNKIEKFVSGGSRVHSQNGR